MTIVYDDIQAVTRLLQEKEKVSEEENSATFKHFRDIEFIEFWFVGLGVDCTYRQRALSTKQQFREESG